MVSWQKDWCSLETMRPVSARMGIWRQVALTMACCRLHNFCLGPDDGADEQVPPLPPQEEHTLLTQGGLLHGIHDEPERLLGAGDHLDDVEPDVGIE